MIDKIAAAKTRKHLYTVAKLDRIMFLFGLVFLGLIVAAIIGIVALVKHSLAAQAFQARAGYNDGYITGRTHALKEAATCYGADIPGYYDISYPCHE